VRNYWIMVLGWRFAQEGENMPRLGAFHLARVIKLQITSETIIETIRDPIPIKKGDYLWTFTDYREITNDSNTIYFAKMTKYILEGEVPQLDHETNTTSFSITPDLIEASSPFVYIPEFSGIGYLHIWNKIEEITFRSRFSKLIEEKQRGFFVDCKLEPISDIKSFLDKIIMLNSIDRIYAKVNPPNPSFGHLWKELDEYMRIRNTDEVTIEEKSDNQIQTNLQIYVQLIASGANLREAVNTPPAIGDAAILMAADGYGNGKIEGKCNGFKTIINTKDNAVVIKLPADIDAETLHSEIFRKLEEISDQRYMGH